MRGKIRNKIFYLLIILPLGLIVFPSLASDSQSTEREQLQRQAKATLQRLQSRSETPIDARWRSERGTLRSLYNLTLSVSAGAPEVAARQFLDEYRDLFALTEAGVELRVRRVQQSLTGTHVRFQQYAHGVEVYGAEVSVHINRFGQIRVVHSNYFPQVDAPGAASISPGEATTIAIADAGIRSLIEALPTELVIFPNLDALMAEDKANAYQLAYRTVVYSREPLGAWEYLIDASTGAVLHRQQLLQFAETGQGRVFNPSPVVTLRDRSLRDDLDAQTAVPDTAYFTVDLPGLDGSGYLDGPYVTTRMTLERAYEPTLVFDYNRADARFEEVMAYYHIDATARYLKSLGFDFVDGIRVQVNARGDDIENSYFYPLARMIVLGTGGVDDGEDAEVIIHEYGHVIQFEQIGFFRGSHETAAISEGFADFLAASYFSAMSGGFRDTTIADWNYVSGSGGRAVNSDKHYPEDMSGYVHGDGMLWSAALWELFEAIGRESAIRLVVESNYLLAPDSTFLDNALALLMTDREINAGQHTDLILDIMERRGILTTPNLTPDAFEGNNTPETAAEIQLPLVADGLSIDSSRDQDYYTFRLEAPKQVGIGIKFVPFYGELRLQLTGYHGQALFTRYTPGVTRIDLSPGDYRIEVSGVDRATNDYALTVVTDIHGDDIDTATPVRVGDVIESFIDFRDDVDVFRFEARKDQVVGVVIEAERVGSALDAVLNLIGQNKNVLATIDDIDGSHDPQISRFRVPADGVYWIEVRSFDRGGDYGLGEGIDRNYTLTLFENGLPEDDHDDLNGTPTVIAAGETMKGLISFRSDVDAFQFTARTDETIGLTVDLASNRSFIAAHLTLYEVDAQTVLAEADDSAYHQRPALTDVKIPEDGVYTVAVKVDAVSGGRDFRYTLRLKVEGKPKYGEYDLNADGQVDLFDRVLLYQQSDQDVSKIVLPPNFAQPRSATPEGEVTMTVTPSVKQTTRQLIATIEARSIVDLYGYQLFIEYQPTLLEFYAASPSSALAGSDSFWRVLHDGSQLQPIQIRQDSPNGVNVNGLLVTLVFNVKAPQASALPSSIRLVKAQLADSQARQILVNIINEMELSTGNPFPAQPVLLQNYPNPCNPETWIPYRLSTDAHVTIAIYTASGRLVRELHLGYQYVGDYTTPNKAAYWDGKDTLGQPVASGLYFYQIRAGDFQSVRRLVVKK